MYANAEEKAKDEQQSQEQQVRLATVSSLFVNGCAKVTFWGEDTESDKEYSYLSNYKPALNDKVLMLKTNSSYVILGDVKYNVAPEEDIDIETLVNTAIVQYLTDHPKLGLYADGTIYLDTANFNTIKKLKGTTATYDYINCKTKFNHTGSQIAFFGATPRGAYPLAQISSDANLETAVSKIRYIISGLRSLGLFTTD